MDEELAYSWPAWKFGMKRADLFTTLHDQYNTFSSTIQDPEAFHHDVFEISHEARTEDEFHRLLADRRQQRLDELNDCLESASLEIIANPKLIGTEQWSIALQLFRSRSLDSLVRYFASYLPEGYLDRHSFHHDDAASTVSSFTDGCSVQSESTSLSSVGDADDDDDVPSLFADSVEAKHVAAAAAPVAREPLRRITTAFKTGAVAHDLPPSPRSMTSHEDDCSSTTSDEHHEHHHHDYRLNFTPARSMSFSGSESDTFSRRDTHLSDDEVIVIDPPVSQPASAISDEDYGSHPGINTRHSSNSSDDDLDDEYEDFSTAQIPCDMFDAIDTVIDSIESETPTPKPEPASISYIDLTTDTTPSRRRPSPLRESPRHHQRTPKSTATQQRAALNIRRSPEEASSRISKPLPDTLRTRTTRGRRRALD